MADFNLNLELVRLNAYIEGVIGEYNRFLDNNNIDWTDDKNEYVAAKAELLNLKSFIYKLKTEEDVQNGNTRVNEIREKIKKAEKNEAQLLQNVGELEIFIGDAETQYLNYILNNRIDLRNKNNEYVAALYEIQDLKSNTYKITTEEEIQKISARITELKDKLLPDGKLDYYNTLEIEVMSEVAASIYATITRYMLKKKRQDDEQDPLNILRHMVFRLKNSLLERDYTMDELKLIKAKFEFAREYANEVIKQNE